MLTNQVDEIFSDALLRRFFRTFLMDLSEQAYVEDNHDNREAGWYYTESNSVE